MKLSEGPGNPTSWKPLQGGEGERLCPLHWGRGASWHQHFGNCGQLKLTVSWAPASTRRGTVCGGLGDTDRASLKTSTASLCAGNKPVVVLTYHRGVTHAEQGGEACHGSLSADVAATPTPLGVSRADGPERP